MEAFLLELLGLIFKDIVAPDVLTITEDSLAGNIKAAPVVMVDAATSPDLDKQVAVSLAAFEATNK